MGLFGFGKKKEEVKGKCCCACGGNRCHIKVLGAGCKSCHEQYENVKKAVAGMEKVPAVIRELDNEQLARMVGESAPQIKRYSRLTNLIPKIL